MFGLGHHNDKDMAPPVGPAPAPETTDPVPEAADAAKPMIEGVPSEIGGDEVRASVAQKAADKSAEFARRDEMEPTVGASTVKSVAPPPTPPELPPAA